MVRINDVIRVEKKIAYVRRVAVREIAAAREQHGFSPEYLAKRFNLSVDEVKAALRYASRNGMLPTMFE